MIGSNSKQPGVNLPPLPLGTNSPMMKASLPQNQPVNLSTILDLSSTKVAPYSRSTPLSPWGHIESPEIIDIMNSTSHPEPSHVRTGPNSPQLDAGEIHSSSLNSSRLATARSTEFYATSYLNSPSSKGLALERDPHLFRASSPPGLPEFGGFPPQGGYPAGMALGNDNMNHHNGNNGTYVSNVTSLKNLPPSLFRAAPGLTSASNMGPSSSTNVSLPPSTIEAEASLSLAGMGEGGPSNKFQSNNQASTSSNSHSNSNSPGRGNNKSATYSDTLSTSNSNQNTGLNICDLIYTTHDKSVYQLYYY